MLTAIEANEPVLASKITGSGQRATLSAVLGDGMKAVTIRVNDVEGVAGFVLPGDRVDVVLTRQQDKNSAAADVVLQNVRVLAVDQIADERTEKPSIAKAVTVEVEVMAAQKLALAATVGTLSLALRKAGESTPSNTRRITVSDLPKSTVTDNRFSTVSVIRGAQRIRILGAKRRRQGPRTRLRQPRNNGTLWDLKALNGERIKVDATNNNKRTRANSGWQQSNRVCGQRGADASRGNQGVGPSQLLHSSRLLAQPRCLQLTRRATRRNAWLR